MSHTSEKRWNEIAGNVSGLCSQMVESLLQAESQYQDLLELYSYVGNNAQTLADQLFYEEWSNRSAPGIKAEITVDVTGGVVSTPTLTEAGSGYEDGTNLFLTLTTTAGGGAADAILSYDVVAGSFANVAVEAGGTTYFNGTDISVLEVPEAGVAVETQANATELAKAQDAVAAMTSLHDIYQAATNVAVPQEDRLVQLRRFT